MRFHGQVSIANGVAAADPVAAPEDVETDLLILLPDRPDAGSGDTSARLILGLIAPAAEAVTLQLWALVEPPRRAGRPQDITVAPGDRVFLLIATGVAVTGTELTQVVTNVPPGGTVYFRRTADTLTTPRVLGVTCAA